MTTTLASLITLVLAGFVSPSLCRTAPHVGVEITQPGTVSIPDSYIVIFRDNVTDVDAATHQDWVHDLQLYTTMKRKESPDDPQSVIKSKSFGGLRHTYNFAGGFLGYSGHFEPEVIGKVQKHPDVLHIERDSEVRRSSHIAGMRLSEPLTQNRASWGLARISHRNRLDFGTFNKYIFAANAGEDVNAYILDTGINIRHHDFEGRASWGTTTTGDKDDDLDGLGTHSAAIVAGREYGVAKKATVTAVKVLSSGAVGQLSDVVKGLNWVTDDHTKKINVAGTGGSSFKGSVAVLGTQIEGGDPQSAFAKAVTAAAGAGIHIAVSTGNDNNDACDDVNGIISDVLLAGVATIADERAYFSSYGRCVDLFAPGLNIQSAWSGSNGAVNTLSGGSAAAAHVAGTLAYFLSLQSDASTARNMTPEKLRTDLVNVATKDVLSNIPSETVNLLLWNGGGQSDYGKIVGEEGASKVLQLNYEL